MMYFVPIKMCFVVIEHNLIGQTIGTTHTNTRYTTCLLYLVVSVLVPFEDMGHGSAPCMGSNHTLKDASEGESGL